ncbi:D-Ala-D-Ala carboxypeptidase [Dokdonia pacifica]|uniref:CubicO group peptidase, beta-lactamase class C family n=1 Tax=Dokdonia pacifica TaxID=1627892 RepID=A0A238ZN32_9FLAO|nr:serine hydrolase domain-containing protein [Dokdonia pacifica]GGG07210.1 D-Ala-D-Ala carboxypeptidase [Dokdonia pacifica]SNR84104.1 CubicO group peptidase, beta-lactamase class C family [Dokdonia pacifica]
MKKITLLFLFSFCTLIAQTEKYDQLDAIFKTLETTGNGMGGISIYQDGKEVYQNAFGYANIEKKIKSTATTKYRIGSVTKMYTSTIIIQLIEEGKLELDTPLSTFFPKLPNATMITVKNLLKHQSGLFNITEDDNFATWMFQPQSRIKMLDRMVKNGVIFEPGTDTSYCNTNYILLGYIAEEITGKSFYDIVQHMIVAPLQLKRTYVGTDRPKGDQEAVSHQRVENQWEVVSEYTEMSAPGGAGAIVSTPLEVNKFTNALYTDKLMSQAFYQQMTDVSTGMGMGLGGMPIMGMQAYGMSGQIDGFKSLAIFFPEQKISMTLVSNAYESSLQEIMMQVLQVFFKN